MKSLIHKSYRKNWTGMIIAVCLIILSSSASAYKSISIIDSVSGPFHPTVKDSEKLNGIQDIQTVIPLKPYHKPNFSIYLDFFSRGLFTICGEFRMAKPLCLSIGTGTGVQYSLTAHFLPGRKASTFELGLGVSRIKFWKHEEIAMTGFIGYRLERKRDFFFRAGLTPYLFFESRYVWFECSIGMSAGFSF